MPLHLLQFAKKLAHDAGKLALHYQKSGVKAETKRSHTELVTEADRACEELIVSSIQKHFPTHSIVSEERPAIEGTGEYKWIIDPIDGTTNFAHGLPWFSVSIAIVHKGKPMIGIVEVPALGESFWAKHGEGAYLGKHRIGVSTTDELKHSLGATGFPYERSSARYSKAFELFEAFYQPGLGVRRSGSAAMDLAYLAAGRLDFFWEYGLQAWDIAAGKIIVEEAGGLVTNMDGTPLNPKLENILASNGLVHNEALAMIKKHGGDKL